MTTQDPELEQRLDPDVGAGGSPIPALTMELTAIARACGASRTCTIPSATISSRLQVEAAAMAQLPLAGTDWIPGRAADRGRE